MSPNSDLYKNQFLGRIYTPGSFWWGRCDRWARPVPGGSSQQGINPHPGHGQSYVKSLHCHLFWVNIVPVRSPQQFLIILLKSQHLLLQPPESKDGDICILGCIFGHIWHILVHIWARAIWSLKRSCKMQFRRVGLRSIGPSSQKLWPNQIFGRFPHCNYNVKLRIACTIAFMGL